jgi:hypothetical protein
MKNYRFGNMKNCYVHAHPMYIVCLETLCTVDETTKGTVRSESRCALRLLYVDLVVSIEVAVEVCCCFTVFSC